MKKFNCAYCGKQNEAYPGHLNRAEKGGYSVYCNRKCSGLGRRDKRSEEEKRAAKKVYDAEYREKNHGRLKIEKAEWYQKTRDPIKEAEHRKKNMARHVEYCRQPKYRKWKQEYDIEYRDKNREKIKDRNAKAYSKQNYGDYAEAHRALCQNETIIKEKRDGT